MAKVVAITQTSNQVTPDLDRIQRQLAQYPAEAAQEFRALTPVRSGNARKHTNLRNQHIIADYPYVKPLDEGHSRQAPQGMVKPFDAWVRKKTKSIFGK